MKVADDDKVFRVKWYGRVPAGKSRTGQTHYQTTTKRVSIQEGALVFEGEDGNKRIINGRYYVKEVEKE